MCLLIGCINGIPYSDTPAKKAGSKSNHGDTLGTPKLADIFPSNWPMTFKSDKVMEVTVKTEKVRLTETKDA